MAAMRPNEGAHFAALRRRGDENRSGGRRECRRTSRRKTDTTVITRPLPSLPRARPKRTQFIQPQQIRVDGRIRAREVRVIVGATNEQLGVMKLPDALRKAQSLGLNLVEVAPNAQPAGLPHRGFRQVPVRALQAGQGEENAPPESSRRSNSASISTITIT